MIKKYIKNCPVCNEIQYYSTKKILLTAIKKNTKCRKCSKSVLSEKEKIKHKELSNKKYRRKNKNKIQKYKKEYYQKNKHEIKKYHTEYRKTKKYKEKRKEYNETYLSKEETKEKRRLYRKEYNQRLSTKKKYQLRDKKIRQNPLVRISQSLSSSIRSSLKTQNLSKNKRHWEDLVGYSLQDLKKYIEEQFKPGMNWDNYGKWHIDHIIPKTFFEYTSTDDVEFKYCWSLNNLQPLWAKDNLIKSNKLFHEKIT